jgi:ribonuclease HII
MTIYKNGGGAGAGGVGGAAKASGTAMIASAVGNLVGDVVTGFIQDKTQKEYNNARIAQLKDDSRLRQLTSEQRLALDEKIANAVNDVAKLRIYEEAVSNLGVTSIETTASIYTQKLKNQSISETRGYYVLAGLSVLLLAGGIYIVKRK